MKRKIKGQKLRETPYKISQNNTGLSVSLPKHAGVKVGDYVYIEKLTDGCLLIVPEKIN